MTTGSESLNMSFYFNLMFSEKCEQIKNKSPTHSLEIN
jgi:hypothetical protein